MYDLGALRRREFAFTWARRDELKAKGVRNFNKVLADEETCSVSLIKQLLTEKRPPRVTAAPGWF